MPDALEILKERHAALVKVLRSLYGGKADGSSYERERAICIEEFRRHFPAVASELEALRAEVAELWGKVGVAR